ncbi:Deoxynucleoside kinase [Giardia muris]|uniref:Deoxynucleoside kinase n=1 Tax=Giardia muris TaxID=5742 RepID=A0A4Z1T4I3_GIAMU|nr:Deoxynucleoside kinase [Giardia muris]|eukprot:TNJ27341.1 Deoxynucleoside kinase [Giardia muris]
MHQHLRRLPGLIVVDGPIGVGKSTFIDTLRKHIENKGLKALLIGEDFVTDPIVAPLMNESYRRPGEFLMLSQTLITAFYGNWHRKILDLVLSKNYDYVIMDRWMLSVVVFTDSGRRNGSITDAQAASLTEFLTHVFVKNPLIPHLYIQLSSSVEDCWKNIILRSRNYELDGGEEQMATLNAFLLKETASIGCLTSRFAKAPYGTTPDEMDTLWNEMKAIKEMVLTRDQFWTPSAELLDNVLAASK